LEQLIGEVGFTDFEIPWKKDIHAGAAQESSALAYSTEGITFRANIPTS
jgi:hypothetical protein